MQVDDRLAALRSDDAPQRAAQTALGEALKQWRAGFDHGELIKELGGLGQVGSLRQLPVLGSLFGDDCSAADRLIAPLIVGLAAALAARPLGHVPLRHFTDGSTSTLLLARAGNASLALVAIDGQGLARRPAPRSVGFAPGETWDRVLAGEADADLVDCDDDTGASLRREALHLCPGDCHTRDSARRTMIVRATQGCLVLLRLQRRRDGEVTREFALADGTLVHQAAGTARDSKLELAAALLGRMGRSDAAPLLAAMAQERGGTALRWQALRECLGLDTRAGFLALSAVARSADDALALPAGALRAQLIEQHPQLSEIEPCPS